MHWLQRDTSEIYNRMRTMMMSVRRYRVVMRGVTVEVTGWNAAEAAVGDRAASITDLTTGEVWELEAR